MNAGSSLQYAGNFNSKNREVFLTGEAYFEVTKQSDGNKIVGDMNTKERKQVIDKFERGDFKELYITYGCGSYGLNLQFYLLLLVCYQDI